jgi:hypothetical protein
MRLLIRASDEFQRRRTAAVRMAFEEDSLPRSSIRRVSKQRIPGTGVSADRHRLERLACQPIAALANSVGRHPS